MNRPNFRLQMLLQGVTLCLDCFTPADHLIVSAAVVLLVLRHTCVFDDELLHGIHLGSKVTEMIVFWQILFTIF